MAQVAERRAKLLKLRLSGVRFDDPQILQLGYTSSASARKDLIRTLEVHRDEEAAAASVYRQQENERLDALLEAAWPRATEPHPVFDKNGELVGEELDMRAVDTVLRLMDRRAKLNGLDMPVKAELSGPDGGPVHIGATSLSELRDLISTAGDPDPDDDDLPAEYEVDDEALDDDGDDDA
jgi:hypothetical protein